MKVWRKPPEIPVQVAPGGQNRHGVGFSVAQHPLST